MTQTSTYDDIAVADRVRFRPQSGNRWWTVRARDERFIIASQQAPFEPKGTERYTVVDLTGWASTYNGVGPGIVRSSLNTLGGSYDLDAPGWADRMLTELTAPVSPREISVRRVMRVDDIEIGARASESGRHS